MVNGLKLRETIGYDHNIHPEDARQTKRAADILTGRPARAADEYPPIASRGAMEDIEKSLGQKVFPIKPGSKEEKALNDALLAKQKAPQTKRLNRWALDKIVTLGKEGRYPEMYIAYAQATNSKWAALAANINGGVGKMGTFAREYWKKAVHTLTGKTVTNEDWQKLSDAIAESFVSHLKNSNGQIRSDTELARGEVVEVLTKGVKEKNIPAYPALSWPGTLAHTLPGTRVFDIDPAEDDAFGRTGDLDPKMRSLYPVVGNAVELSELYSRHQKSENHTLGKDGRIRDRSGKVIGWKIPEYAEMDWYQTLAFNAGALLDDNIEPDRFEDQTYHDKRAYKYNRYSKKAWQLNDHHAWEPIDILAVPISPGQ